MSAATRKAEASAKRKKDIAKIDSAKASIVEDAAKLDADRASIVEQAAEIERACGSHIKQREFVTAAIEVGARVVVCGGRQGGKSRGAFKACDLILSKGSDLQGLWIGLSANAVKTTTWPSIKRYLREWGLLDNKALSAPPQVTITESPATITWPNNSRLILLGTDDSRFIESLRGGTNAIVVIDEIQSQPYELVQGLIEDIVEPSLVVTDGPIIVLGTPPRKRIGWFSEIWHNSSGYRKFHFTGADNPATAAKFQKHVEKIAAGRCVDWKTDARVRREWFGEWIDDVTNAILPNFSQTRNLFTPGLVDKKPTHVVHPNGFHILPGPSGPLGLPVGRWYYSLGIDGGQLDRLALELMGWCDSDPRIWQCAEYVAPKGAKSPPSVWVPYINQLIAMFGAFPIYLDQSGVSVSTLQIDYHLHTTKAAVKTEREDQITRFNDLCSKGWMQIAEFSALAEDCSKGEWLPSRGVGNRREYSPAHKIDPLDGARYACAGYWDIHVPTDTRAPEEKARDDSKKRIQELVEASRRRHETPTIVDFSSDITDW